MYVVVACSRCKLARIAGADQKTAECPRCGRRIDLKKTRIYLVTEEMEVATGVLASVNESLAGPPPDNDGSWGDLRPDGREDSTPAPRRDLISVARNLSADGAAFTADELAAGSEISIEKVTEALEKWSSEGVVYSPEHGTYVLVDPL